MYYGAGAGKLPTASAVVSDVVDCARHLGKTVTCIWDEEQVKLQDYRKIKRQFFVRVKQEGEARAEAVFGKCEKLELIPGEFGFLTEVMSEGEFEEKAAALPEMITRIRVEN
jgi:homoserine dehydrogenase